MILYPKMTYPASNAVSVSVVCLLLLSSFNAISRKKMACVLIAKSAECNTIAVHLCLKENWPITMLTILKTVRGYLLNARITTTISQRYANKLLTIISFQRSRNTIKLIKSLPANDRKRESERGSLSIDIALVKSLLQVFIQHNRYKTYSNGRSTSATTVRVSLKNEMEGMTTKSSILSLLAE